MAFNVAYYDYNSLRSSVELARDLQAVQREIKAKETLYASRCRDLESSVSQAPGVLSNDGGIRAMQRELRKLRDLYVALKAKHYFIYIGAPYNKEAEQQRVDIAVQGCRQLRRDVSYAIDFAMQIEGFDEDDGAKKRLAELEAKLLVAFNFLKSGECKVQAVDAHKTRHGAAERVMLAYKNKLRLRAADGKDAIEAVRAEFDEAVALWNTASEECRMLRNDVKQCVFPVHGASKVQRVVQSYFFQEKLRKHGEEAALAYATSLGVDAKYHLEAQRNAKRTFKETFGIDAEQAEQSGGIDAEQAEQSGARAQAVNNEATSDAAVPSSASIASQNSTVASSWDQLSADSSAVASLDRTATTNGSGASLNATGTTIGSWFMTGQLSRAEQPSRSLTSRCSRRSAASITSSAARRFEATDSDDSDATVADLPYGAVRTSTPIAGGDANGAEQSGRAFAAEFGDTSTDSLASYMPRGGDALRRPQVQGSFAAAAGSVKAVRPAVLAQGRFGYISESERSATAAGVSMRSTPAQYFAAANSQAHRRNAQRSPVAFFDSIQDTEADAEQSDEWEVVVDHENRTAWFGPLRRNLGNATFLTLVRNGAFGHAFGASAVQCSVGNSNPQRLAASRRPRAELDEPYATVTFSTRADAALCIRLVNDTPGDYGVTPMGDNGAPRKLDAEWCENRHLNGYNKAPRRYIRRL